MIINYTHLRRLFAAVSFVFCLAVTAYAQSNAQTGKTAGMGGAPRDQAARLLQKNIRLTGLSQAAVNSYVVTDAYVDRKAGTFMVYLQQTYQDIPVYNKIGTYVFKNDTLVSKSAGFIPVARWEAGAQSTPAVDGIRAIRAAAGHLLLPIRQEPRLLSTDQLKKRFLYSSSGVSQREIPSDLVWLVSQDGLHVRLAWNVRIATPDGNGDWMIRVDAQTGEVIEKSSLIVSEKNSNDCAEAGEIGAPAGAVVGGYTASQALFGAPAVTDVSYRVYPFPLQSANYGSRVVDLNPWLRAGPGDNATTLGWHYNNTANFLYTRGNNVWAQEDLAGSSLTNGFADTSLTAIPSLSFDKPIDMTKSPVDYSNIRAGIDNLFYWNNILHDISYQYGFDEAAGNFQASNQGRGGVEGDYVNAFSQDGGGLNNSDFLTPPDGQNPRMRMFQWSSNIVYGFHVNAPSPAVGDYNDFVEGGLSFKGRLSDHSPITEDIVLVNDAVGGLHQACGAFSNAASLAGKIALLDRGGSGCPFTLKVKNAQNAGAVAVLVANNVSGPATGLGGIDTTIVIPAVMITLAEGNIFKANLTGLNGTLSASGVYIDGSLDNGIIAHEYTHGISTRLTGGPANSDCLNNAEQMGEGWSDYLALMVTTDWSTASSSDGPNARPIGTYALGQLPAQGGIRKYPYSTDMGTNPWTYDMLATNTNGEPHFIGEIWCAAIWDMTWNIIQQEGIDADIYHGTKGNNIALQLVMTGMKLQPCSPGFLDGRDAILKADSLLYNNRHKCAIWQAFARRGMGKSALQGSSNSYIDQTAATDLPKGMGISITSNKTLLAQGDNVTYTVKASCDCQVQTGISIVNTLSPFVTYVSSTGGSDGGIYSSPAVTWAGNDFAAGETRTFTVTGTVNAAYQTPVDLINDTRDPVGYTSWTSSFTDVTTRAHSGTHSWFAQDAAFLSAYELTSGDLLLNEGATLSFWHYYETDPANDGGVVEISTDAGSTWQDLGGYMTQNGYNSSLDPATAVIPNRQAFSGSTGGQFIPTVVALDAFAGTTARIRFRFATNSTTAGDGWYIDDILVTNERGARDVADAFKGATLLMSKSLSSKFSSTPLPVDFISFDVKKQDQAVLLRWTVSEELNVARYIVERSGDGNSYVSIGELPATKSGDYSFVDGQPLTGRDFYRIRETDRDGKSALSPVRVVQFGNTALDVRLWPVPTYNHSVQLEVQADNATSISATLQNAIGQTLKAFVIRQGINLLNLDGVSRGIYFLKIQTNKDDIEIRRIVIQ